MDIDYQYGDLSDDEIAEHMANRDAEERIAREQDDRRWSKARQFRFQGGMC